jgi:hypothetical protein
VKTKINQKIKTFVISNVGIAAVPPWSNKSFHLHSESMPV